MSSLSTKEQLLKLKAMTIRFGVLHEAQALQIRNYPLLIPGVISAEANVSIERKSVSYSCKGKNNRFRNTAKAKESYKMIEQWIRTILWDDTYIEVTVNNKLIYNSGMVNEQ